MKAFNGKNAYITGGSSGIGFSTALLLSSLGANVIIFARNRKKMDKAIHEIEAKRIDENQKCAAMQLDVTSNSDVKRTMQGAINTFGKPDILINCAGMAYPDYFEKIPEKKFDETIRTNLYGMRNTIAALLPALRERKGRIVNVASIAGFIGVFGYTAYTASKYAVVGFSESLRSELKHCGIVVSVLCPPDTDTPGLQLENRTKPPETRAVSESAKLMHPDDVAKALVKALDSKKFIILPGIEGKLIWRIKRFFPSLVELIMDMQVRAAQRKKSDD